MPEYLKGLEWEKLLVTILASIIISLINAGFKGIYSWFKKKETLKTSKISLLFIKFSIIEICAALFIPLILVYGMLGIIFILGLNESNDPNLLIKISYILKVLMILFHLMIVLFLLIKLKILKELNKYVKRHKIFYYGIFIIYPIMGCFIGLAIFDLNSFEKVANFFMLIILMCYILGSIILAKPKKFNYYSKVKIKFAGESYRTFKYENVRIEDKFVIIELRDSVKKIKDVYYNLNSIESIDYIVDNHVDEKYEDYLYHSL